MSSLLADWSRESAPDDRLREAIHHAEHEVRKGLLRCAPNDAKVTAVPGILVARSSRATTTGYDLVVPQLVVAAGAGRRAAELRIASAAQRGRTIRISIRMPSLGCRTTCGAASMYMG